jgi:hypothetical protein
MRVMRISVSCSVLLVVSLSGACSRARTRSSDDGSVVRADAGDGGGLDAGPRTCDSVRDVDFVFVIDNSGSMSEEHWSFGAALPRFFEALASGDRDGDGAADFPAAQSIQVGVITTDMGTGGFRVPTCAEPNFGDDGILRTAGNTAIPGCMALYPPFLAFRPAVDDRDAASYAADVMCVSAVGTGGCAWEQPLEAALKAVTRSTSSLSFHMGTAGHGDRANSGSVRPGSLLAVVVLTDEEDCSESDPRVFDPGSPTYPGDLNLRCFQYPGALHATERYSDGLLATRERPEDLLYAVIAGVPPHLAGADYATILADPDMQEMVDPDNPTRLRPSCNVPGRGLAFPPRRLVEVAQEIDGAGGAGVVSSVCNADLTGALDRVLAPIEARLRGDCP